MPYFIPKRGSVTQKVECCPRGFQLTWPFPLFTSLLPVYTRHKHPRARSRLQMSSQLCWLHTDTVTLCSISFSGRRESPISCGWEWGRPFGQVAIFLLFQELGEAFELSPVKIAFAQAGSRGPLLTLRFVATPPYTDPGLPLPTASLSTTITLAVATLQPAPE